MQHRSRPPTVTVKSPPPENSVAAPRESRWPLLRLARHFRALQAGRQAGRKHGGVQHERGAGDVSATRNRSPRGASSAGLEAGRGGAAARRSDDRRATGFGRLLHHLRGAQFLRAVRFVSSFPTCLSPFASHAEVALARPRDRARRHGRRHATRRGESGRTRREWSEEEDVALDGEESGGAAVSRFILFLARSPSSRLP